ncbi:unnamed protein product, partial [Bubo scandiacus]
APPHLVPWVWLRDALFSGLSLLLLSWFHHPQRRGLKDELQVAWPTGPMVWILMGLGGCKTHPGRDLWPMGLREAGGLLSCKPRCTGKRWTWGKLTVGLGERCASDTHGCAWHGAG